MSRERLGFWPIWNMSFGFLGIQFGWGLQMANMSAIYEYLGARPDQLSKLWLAAPLTGLLVQPVIGALSDRTWTRLGRRRPYFLAGALLSSAALVLMPNSSALWMAAGLLWILDASINVSMEPFRAFVADLLPEEQRTDGFAMQSLFIGLGAVIASALPFLMANVFGVSRSAEGGIPPSVRWSFYVGAAAFLAAVAWTVVSTREHPPEDLPAFRRRQAERRGAVSALREIFDALGTMPATMRQLALVQMCTWFGLFCMWLYFPVAVARSVFGAPDEKSPLYTAGIEWAGLCFGLYSAVCFAFSFALPRVSARLGRQRTHGLCLLAGGAGLLSVGVVHDKWLLFLSMAGVGIAWASILSMPYAMLARSLPPHRVGVYMGIFNFFIVIPEIVVALTFDDLMMPYVFRYSRLGAVVAGGLLMVAAAALTQRVREAPAGTVPAELREAV
jgi:maltose/moltooligosaccharide transporter